MFLSSHSFFPLLPFELSVRTVSLFFLMRPALPWWWVRQRVIKVVSYLVGKLTSIRSILARGHSSSPLCPPTPPSFLPHYSVQFLTPIHHSVFFLTHSLNMSQLPISYLVFQLLFLPYLLAVMTRNSPSQAVLFCDGNQPFLRIVFSFFFFPQVWWKWPSLPKENRRKKITKYTFVQAISNKWSV